VAAVLAVLGGVIEEVDDDLFQAAVDRQNEGMPSQIDQRLDRLSGTVEDRGGVEDFAAELDLAEVDAGDVEQVVDQP
jgi:hypothetical protein